MFDNFRRDYQIIVADASKKKKKPRLRGFFCWQGKSAMTEGKGEMLKKV
jgi:hypothetical protein